MPNPHFPKLNDANYVDWHYMMAATLIEKDLWDVVDSSLTRPVSSPNHKAMKTFVKKQQLACAKIILSIKASQLSHTRHDDPKVIWEIACRRCTRPVAKPHTYHSAAASSTCANGTTNPSSYGSQMSKRPHSSSRPQAYLQ